MDIFRVEGGNRLMGEITNKAAKNAVLPILAASVMNADQTVLFDCPKLEDIENMCRILKRIGCRVERNSDQLTVNSSKAVYEPLPEELTGRLRSSVFMLGPLITRFRKACVAYPGGCDIGQRPIDLHLKGFRALGVRIKEKRNYIELDGRSIRPAEILLDFPSVGATENLMMACATLYGKSVILNAACEPEIRDLACFLNKMGAGITGAGTGRIEVEGKGSFSGVSYRPIPDRIYAGTILSAAAVAGGNVVIKNTVKGDMAPIVGKLREMGAEIDETEETTQIFATGKLKAVNIQTQPHPGFPTDMQSQMTALLSVASGTGVVTENLFENRFMHAAELRKMGADITVYGRRAFIRGGALHGARVKSRNLRAGAALVIAALAAKGITEIEDVRYIDRGYERLENALNKLGAKIERTNDVETEDIHGERKPEEE